MQLNSIIIAISALALGMANGASIQKRVPQLGGFTLATKEGCPINSDSNPQRVTILFGQACGDCVRSTPWNNSTFKAITGMDLDRKCQVTLFNKPDCSDQGIVSGPDCWTPEGGIAAYKVACPWWPEDSPSGSLKPCYR